MHGTPTLTCAWDPIPCAWDPRALSLHTTNHKATPVQVQVQGGRQKLLFYFHWKSDREMISNMKWTESEVFLSLQEQCYLWWTGFYTRGNMRERDTHSTQEPKKKGQKEQEMVPTSLKISLGPVKVEIYCNIFFFFSSRRFFFFLKRVWKWKR